MQAHPRIRFVQIETGERLAALCDGPQVWVIAESWLAHEQSERSAATIAEVLGLTQRDIEAALNYWADHRAEIDEVVARHRAAQDDALAAWERREALSAA